jgi:glycosyltransferase involved in cell wall biosynthesis
MKDLQKRISLALKIWKLVENSPESEGWYLKIIGEGEDLQTYKKMTKLLNLHRVVFLGRQNPQPFYVKASLAMMTSSFEGWGLTLTESQQFGVVPLAFDSYASAKDIITNGENGFLIPYGDLKLYSILLLKLMKNAELRHKMAASAIKSVKRFEIDEIVSRWLALLKGVAGTH